MSKVTCSNCNHVVPAHQVNNGWCENCEKLPFSFGEQATDNEGSGPSANRRKSKSNSVSLACVIFTCLIWAILRGGPLRSFRTGLLADFCLASVMALAAISIFGVFAALKQSK